MSIETYATIVVDFYLIAFLALALTGVARLWMGIRRKSFGRWWRIPYAMLYSLFAAFSTFIPFIAYNDLADPNYVRYKGWELNDFLIHDGKVLAIGLTVGILLDWALKSRRRSDASHSNSPRNSN